MGKRKGGFPTFTIDDYEIRKDGTVFNKRWKRPVKPELNGKGYYRIRIGGKRYFLHRLVAEKYIPNPLKKEQVNHIDGDRTNNCVSNLEWVTNQENRDYAKENGLIVHGERCPWAKLTQADVDFIRSNPQLSNKELSQKFGVSRRTISDIRCFQTWKMN